MKINLGCGEQIMEGWTNIDLHFSHPLVIRDDITTLKKASLYIRDSVITIYCAHTLIYVPYSHTKSTFQRWYEILSQNGKAYIEEPENKEDWEGIKYLRRKEDVIEALQKAGFKHCHEISLPSWSRHSGGYCVEGTK